MQKFTLWTQFGQFDGHTKFAFRLDRNLVEIRFRMQCRLNAVHGARDLYQTQFLDFLDSSSKLNFFNFSMRTFTSFYNLEASIYGLRYTCG